MDAFAALADPTRRGILEVLATSGQLAAGDIHGRFDSTPSAISQHLKVLREAELVHVEKRAQQRIYTINPMALDDMARWIQRTRTFWNARLDALEALLQAEDEAMFAEKEE